MPIDDNTSIRFSPEEDQGEYTVRPGEELIRPVGAPNTAKDFKKILSSKDKRESKKGQPQIQQKMPFGSKLEEVGEQQEDEEAGLLALSNDKHKKTDPVFSLFDLQKNAPALAEEPSTQLSAPAAISSVEDVQTSEPPLKKGRAAPSESPFHLASKTAHKDVPGSTAIRDIHAEKKAMEADFSTQAPAVKEVSTDDTKTKRTSTAYAEDRPDLSFVNPFAAAAQNTAAIESSLSRKVEQTTPVNTQMAEIARQLIEKMYIVERNGNTDTVIELKYPPLFQGASLTVTAFDSAKGELNISFTGLTQEAQRILDNQANQINLLAALHDKGYNVHIISTSTKVEEAPTAPDESREKEDRGGESREQRTRRTSRGGADSATA